MLIGGTGPTGPHIAQGLLDRGYELSIYHRGFHETDDMPQCNHIHGDPYTKESLEQDVGREWDLVVCTYGRLRTVADVMANRTSKLVAAGGRLAYTRPENLPFPQGLAMPYPEDSPTVTEFSEANRHAFGVAHTERVVMEHHRQGHFKATIFRYGGLTSPRTPRNYIWPIVRRIIDKRPHIIMSRTCAMFPVYATDVNAAHLVLLACDKPEADGQIFNTADERQYRASDRIRIVADELKHDWEMVWIDHPLAEWCAEGYTGGNWPQEVDMFKAKTLLGYRDIESPEEGIRKTARWLRDNRYLLDEPQMAVGLGNPYAYDVEDRLIAMYKRWSEEVSREMPTPPRWGGEAGNVRQQFDRDAPARGAGPRRD